MYMLYYSFKLFPSSKHAHLTVPSSEFLPALSVMFIVTGILYREVLDPPSGSFSTLAMSLR